MATIQIHELTSLGRSPESSDVFAVDTGTATRKITYAAIIGGATTSVQSDISAIQSDISTLQSTVSVLSGSLSTVESDISGIESDISALSGGLSTVGGNVSALQSTVTALGSGLSTAQGDISTLQSGLSTANGSITSLQSAVSTLSGGLSAAQSNISALQSSVSSINSTITSIQASVSTAQTTADKGVSDALAALYAAEAVATTYDGAVTLQCDDKTWTQTLLPGTKHGMLLMLHGAAGDNNVRLRIYGNGDSTVSMVSTSAPNYSGATQEWYFDACQQFISTHEYRFDVVLLFGSIDRGGSSNKLYLDLRNHTSNESKTVYDGDTWTCDFQPEMVCFSARNFTYVNAVIWLKITDLTVANAAVDALDTRMTNAEARLDALDKYGLPSYYTTRHESDPILSDWIAALMAKDGGNPGESVRFGFITDVHVSASDNYAYHNSKYSPGLMCAVRDMANVGTWFFGGDAITGDYATKDAARVDLSYFRQLYKDIWPDMYSVFGNHDYGNNGNNSGVTSNWDDVYWVYNALIRDKERGFVSIHGPKVESDTRYSTKGWQAFGSYVMDCEAEKVRFICMSENFGGNFTHQKDWLEARLNEKESGWTIIIINHRSVVTDNGSVIIDAKLTNSNSIMPVCTAYNTTGKATVACIIGGHCHYDYVMFAGGEHEPTDGVYSGTGIPVIAVTCDLNGKNGEDYTGRTTGTTFEQAFDVFQIDTRNRMIYTTRIGGGSDRAIRYNAAT